MGQTIGNSLGAGTFGSDLRNGLAALPGAIASDWNNAPDLTKQSLSSTQAADLLVGAALSLDGGGALSDDAIAARGGLNNPENFTNGSGVTTDANGLLNGVSVNSANGASLGDLSQGIPNGQVGSTTVGAIRDAGGDVVPAPTDANPNHAIMSGIDANTASGLFQPTVPNPSR